VDESEEVFDFLYYLIYKVAEIEKGKAASLASQFTTLTSFKKIDFTKQKFIRMEGTEIKFQINQRNRIENLKQFICESTNLKENWMRYLAKNFVSKQLHNIGKLSLETMNMNPFLIKALNLTTPDEVVRFNVYQTATRSIVTSMGFTLEKMVGHSGARMGEKGEWYDVVKEIGELTYWIQIKSGPNDMDADQVKYFSEKFDKTEGTENYLARLGITYGKKHLKTISMNFIRSHLGSWEERTLVGKDLWDFVSGEKNYHEKVLKYIGETSILLLQKSSIEKEIEKAINRIISEFESKYGKGEKGVTAFIEQIL